MVHKKPVGAPSWRIKPGSMDQQEKWRLAARFQTRAEFVEPRSADDMVPANPLDAAGLRPLLAHLGSEADLAA